MTNHESRKHFARAPWPLLAAGLGLGAVVFLVLWGTDAAPSTEFHAALPAKAQWRFVEDFPQRLAVFESVFWEPEDTLSLRQQIRRPGWARGKSVLEIGTGSGLLSLCCLRSGASRVVATDVNPAAIENAVYNARALGVHDRLQFRRVPLGETDAYGVVGASEKFDLIVSNPPWEDRRPESAADHALYDPDFALLRSLLAGLRDHLTPGGRALLAYGCKQAIFTVHTVARERQLEVRVLDDRNLAELPDVFLPGMLLEVRTQTEADTEHR